MGDNTAAVKKIETDLLSFTYNPVGKVAAKLLGHPARAAFPKPGSKFKTTEN